MPSDLPPDEDQLRARFDERKTAFKNNDYETWLTLLPPKFVDELNREYPDELRPMFDEFATGSSEVDLLEICDCRDFITPQGNPVVRCRTLTRFSPPLWKTGEDVKLLEMWQYESEKWFWGFTDHHPISKCPDR